MNPSGKIVILASRSDPWFNLQDTVSSYINEHAKLPKRESSKFNENVLNFIRFWNYIDASIHRNTNLKGMNKFNYLKSYRSIDMICGLSLTTKVYSRDVKILQERYCKRQDNSLGTSVRAWLIYELIWTYMEVYWSVLFSREFHLINKLLYRLTMTFRIWKCLSVFSQKNFHTWDMFFHLKRLENQLFQQKLI